MPPKGTGKKEKKQQPAPAAPATIPAAPIGSAIAGAEKKASRGPAVIVVNVYPETYQFYKIPKMMLKALKADIENVYDYALAGIGTKKTALVSSWIVGETTVAEVKAMGVEPRDITAGGPFSSFAVDWNEFKAQGKAKRAAAKAAGATSEATAPAKKRKGKATTAEADGDEEPTEAQIAAIEKKLKKLKAKVKGEA